MANSEEQQKSSKVTRRGLLLKETREVKGLSIETVHEMTKIPLDVLHAIEEGYTVRMVSAYYFKGFIKMYAKFLGLDSSLVLDEPMPANPTSDEPVSIVADPQHKKFNEYITRQNKKQMVVGFFLLGIGVVFVATVFIFWLKRPKSDVVAPVVHVVKKESSKKKLLEMQAEDRKMLEKSKVKPRVEETPVPRAAVVDEAPPPDVIEESHVEKAKKSSSARKVTLSIKSRAAGWLQVKVDGNLVFQSTLRAGAAESWEADKSIELSGKNINNLEFEVNGKVLGQLGKSDRGARRVVVNSEGLTVKK